MICDLRPIPKGSRPTGVENPLTGGGGLLSNREPLSQHFQVRLSLFSLICIFTQRCRTWGGDVSVVKYFRVSWSGMLGFSLMESISSAITMALTPDLSVSSGSFPRQTAWLSSSCSTYSVSLTADLDETESKSHDPVQMR